MRQRGSCEVGGKEEGYVLLLFVFVFVFGAKGVCGVKR